VGDRVELYLGNQTKTWYRDVRSGRTMGSCRISGCSPFPNSILQKNGSLIFESVRESDSGTYYMLADDAQRSGFVVKEENPDKIADNHTGKF
ncbi:hypothetical protein GCK32_003560, partial [Trichostrongylus colubriformis]